MELMVLGEGIAIVGVLGILIHVVHEVSIVVILKKIKKRAPDFYRELLGEQPDSFVDREGMISKREDWEVWRRLRKAIYQDRCDHYFTIKPRIFFGVLHRVRVALLIIVGVLIALVLFEFIRKAVF